ncbi:hypothetical protein [Vogesella indigofera]|uniref:hypothetical protein n=1 Tax=Vogesella indigofera TaxID=45465 RepID=UPI003F43A19A
MKTDDWIPIRLIPDCEITLQARDYLKAAHVCFDGDLAWVSGVNAAFSIELFLKAYLVRENRKLFQKKFFRGRSTDYDNGHGLTGLLSRIPEDVRLKILELAKEKSIDVSLLLSKCDGVFENARYAFERDNSHKIMMRNSDLLILAEFFSGIAEKMECQNPERIKFDMESNREFK